MKKFVATWEGFSGPNELSGNGRWGIIGVFEAGLEARYALEATFPGVKFVWPHPFRSAKAERAGEWIELVVHQF